MKTTITLDPDVEALVQKAVRERGVSFHEALNSAVRAALIQGKSERPCFVQKTYRLGTAQNFRSDKALDVASALEDDELIRKFSSRR